MSAAVVLVHFTMKSLLLVLLFCMLSVHYGDCGLVKHRAEHKSAPPPRPRLPHHLQRRPHPPPHPLQRLFHGLHERSQRQPTRLIRGRPTHHRKPHKKVPIPNFVYLPAEELPGYETFKLHEVIRKQEGTQIFDGRKPDVIHYVDSPEIAADKKPAEKENSIVKKEIKKEDEISELIDERTPKKGKTIVSSIATSLPLTPKAKDPQEFDQSPTVDKKTAVGGSDTVLVKLIRYDPDQPGPLTRYPALANPAGSRHLQSHFERGGARKKFRNTGTSYLPIQVRDTRFPIPNIPELQNKLVKSIVLLAPDDFNS